MPALITYDVSAKHTLVKDAMKARGYNDQWLDDQGRTVYLPNTTLWGKNVSLQQALEDIATVTSALGVKLERAVAVPSFPWTAIFGEPHAK